MARKERLWDPNVCLTFGQKTLEFLQEKITIDDMNTTYIIKYSPETRSIEVNEPDKDGSDIFIHKGLF
jgi:hypothetical protein